MTDENTKDLTDREVLDLILQRLDALEESRAGETKPQLQTLNAYIDKMNAELVEFRAEMQAFRDETKAALGRLDTGFTQFSRELMDLKARQDEIERRVAD